MNDILMEDNKVFNEEDYKFKPPVRDPEQFKAENLNNENAGNVAAKNQVKRICPDNKENDRNTSNFDPNQAVPRRTTYHQKQNFQAQKFPNKKNEVSYFPHPEVHFCNMSNRDELAEDVELRNNTIHLFGVDFFNENEIMGFFENFNPQKIEWINDSSCNIVFEEDTNASNAIFSLSTQIDDNIHELDWRKSLDYEKDGRVFNLMMRNATAADKKDEVTKGVNSKYYKYVRQEISKKRAGANNGMRKKIGKEGYNDRRGPNNRMNNYAEKKPNTMTIMDRKKTLKRQVLRNNVEVMNQFPNRNGGEQSYNKEYYEEEGYENEAYEQNRAPQRQENDSYDQNRAPQTQRSQSKPFNNNRSNNTNYSNNRQSYNEGYNNDDSYNYQEYGESQNQYNNQQQYNNNEQYDNYAENYEMEEGQYPVEN